LSAPSVRAAGGTCPLCGVTFTAEARRCPACGWSLAGIDGRPGPYSARALWWTGTGFVAVYLITLAIVALTH
jgi:hypothetical protein